MTLLPERFIF